MPKLRFTSATQRAGIDEIDTYVTRHLEAGRIMNVQYKDLNYLITKATEREGRPIWENCGLEQGSALKATVYDYSAMYGWGAFEVVKKAKQARKDAVLNYPYHDELQKKAVQDIKNFLARWEPLCERFLSLKPLIVKGRIPSENPRAVPERTLDHTGTCGICGRNIKMRGAILVDHGYTKGYGFRNGICFGAHYKPIEISPEVLQAYLDYCQKRLATLPNIIVAEQERLTKLQAEFKAIPGASGVGTLDPIVVDLRKKLAACKYRIMSLTSEQNALPEVIKDTSLRIKAWKVKPLPDQKV